MQQKICTDIEKEKKKEVTSKNNVCFSYERNMQEF